MQILKIQRTIILKFKSRILILFQTNFMEKMLLLILIMNLLMKRMNQELREIVLFTIMKIPKLQKEFLQLVKKEMESVHLGHYQLIKLSMIKKTK